MVVESVSLNLMAKVFGIDQVQKLTFSLESLKNKRMVNNQLKKQIVATNERHLAQLRTEVMQRKLQMRGATKNLDNIIREEIRLQSLNALFERSNGLRKEKTMLMMQEGRFLTTNAEKQGFAILMEQKHAEAARQTAAAMKMKQREILAVTMSIFGMTMSIWQITNALSAMAGENEVLKKDFKQMQALMMGATGPLLLFNGILQITTMTASRLGNAMAVMLPMTLAIATAYLALTSGSRELRIVMGALTGVLVALTGIKIAHAIATRMEANATIASTIAKIGELAVASLGTLLPVLAGAVIGAGLIAGTLPQAQTEPGQFRFMKSDATIRAHQDEVVSKPQEMFGGGTRGGGDTYLIVDGQQIDHTQAKATQRDTYIGWG